MGGLTRRGARVAVLVMVLGAVWLAGGTALAVDSVAPQESAVEDAPTDAVGEARGAGETAEGVVDGAGRTAGDVGDHVGETTEGVVDSVGGTTEEAVDDADEALQPLTEPVTESLEAVGDAVDRRLDSSDATGVLEDGLHRHEADDPALEPTAPSGAADAPPTSTGSTEAPSPPAAAASAAAPGGESASDGPGRVEPSSGDGEAAAGSPGFEFDRIGPRAAFPVALVGVLAAFLAVQGWMDRREPKLASAPLEAEPDLAFEAR